MIISKRKQNGSLLFLFHWITTFVSLAWEYNDLSDVKRQTPFSELTADFIATVIYLYRFA